MQFNLKTTILVSGAVAASLNVIQFFATYTQGKDAFSPSWAYASSNTPAPSAAPAKLTAIQPGTPPATLASNPPAAPANTDTATVATRLSSAGLKPDFAALYLQVQHATGTPWQLLAAVHEVETGGSGNTSRRSSAGATGPMQFMPGTFNHYALDGDGNGTKDITNVNDAVMTAGHYLAAGGADHGQYATALYNYNHSWSYVSKVTGIYSKLGL